MADSNKTGKNKRRKQLGSVDAFWEDHPKLHAAKQTLDASLEIFLLARASKAISEDDGKICEDAAWNEHFDEERIRVCIDLMVFIHVLHLCRLLFQCCQKYGRGKQNACKGCLRCLLIDCYCCTGTVVYLYVQISFWLDFGTCNDELPFTKEQLRLEIVYQYARIFWFFLSNLLVVLYILFIQRKFEKSQVAE